MPKSSKEEWSPELTWTRPPLLLFHRFVIREEDKEMTLVDGDRKNQDISRMAIERTKEDFWRCGALRTICVHRPHGRYALRQELVKAWDEEPRRVLVLTRVTSDGSCLEDETGSVFPTVRKKQSGKRDGTRRMKKLIGQTRN